MSAVAVCLLALAGCGGGERQDENEASGDFPVEVVKASFPEKQKLAKSSDFVVTVRNAGRKTIPNIGLTIKGFEERKNNPDLADADRPVFAINGVQVRIAGRDYELTYTVRTDGIGLYRGTFGSTAARGTYTLSAETETNITIVTFETAPRSPPVIPLG